MSERAGFFVDDADVPGLRAAISKLAALGYSETGISNCLGLQDLEGLQWRLVSIYRSERLAGRERLALAIDLLLLQGALPPDELGRLFDTSEADVLIRAGVLAIDRSGVARSRASLFPFGDNLIFSDHAWPHLPHPGYVTVPSDQVMWIGLDSRHLAYCTSRRPIRNALDLCTGSGIHALLAAVHTERVLAIDINPRAACCTRFNAAVSGAANLEVAVADLYEGARGERFDLITANPPFVPSPLNSLGFRDGGRSGEDILKRIVAGLPQHLAPGGVAQIITELGERDDESLVLRLRQWLSGAAMDIHILRVGEHEAMKYATRHAKGDNFEVFLASVHEWASNLLAQGYRRVVSVVISFRWSDTKSGPPWDLEEQSPPPHRAAGAEIDALFEAQRVARQVDWQTLKNSWLSRAGPVALLDARVLGGNIRAKAKATLLGQALTIEHHVDPVEREILDRMDGPVRVSELTGICRDPAADEPIIEAAIRSLLRRRLIDIDKRIGSPRH